MPSGWYRSSFRLIDQRPHNVRATRESSGLGEIVDAVAVTPLDDDRHVDGVFELRGPTGPLAAAASSLLLRHGHSLAACRPAFNFDFVSPILLAEFDCPVHIQNVSRKTAKPEDITVTRARGHNRVRVSIPRGMAWPNGLEIHVAIANSAILLKRHAGPLQRVHCERVLSSDQSEYSYVTCDEHREAL